jgi:transposase
MRTSQKTAGIITTIGIDLGKNTFHLVGFDQRGAIILQQKVSRGQLERRLANIPRCLIGMEACSGSHHIGRQLQAAGHDVRLIPAQYVKPFLKGHKNDYRDAEAIAEAVLRPTMHFVAIKTPEQMDLLALHRVRSRLVSQRTGVINLHVAGRVGQSAVFGGVGCELVKDHSEYDRGARRNEQASDCWPR